MPKRKILYIAGPYRAATINKTYHNIHEARRRMEWAWVNGYIPICPHMNSAFIDGIVEDEVIFSGYCRLVAGCDVIMMIDGWEESNGSIEELIVAERNQLERIPDPFGGPA